MISLWFPLTVEEQYLRSLAESDVKSFCCQRDKGNQMWKMTFRTVVDAELVRRRHLEWLEERNK